GASVSIRGSAGTKTSRPRRTKSCRNSGYIERFDCLTTAARGWFLEGPHVFGGRNGGAGQLQADQLLRRLLHHRRGLERGGGLPSGEAAPAQLRAAYAGRGAGGGGRAQGPGARPWRSLLRGRPRVRHRRARKRAGVARPRGE